QPRRQVLRLAVEALGRDANASRQLEPSQLEVAVLDRTRPQKRKFRRLRGAVLEELLAPEGDEEGGSDRPEGGSQGGGGAAGGSGNRSSGDGGEKPTDSGQAPA